ncbi:MAG: acetyl-CoA carboxylase biotin carboxyl carrier protein [Crocinitomicaceae bacterium]
MNIKEIQDLIKFVARQNVTEVEIEQKDFKLTIKSEETKSEAQPIVVQAPAAIQQPIAAAPAPVAQVAAAPAPAAPAAAPADEESNYIKVLSPMIGTFYRSPGPDKDNFVSVGDTIKPGDVVCIIEAMKLFNEIEAEVSGKIVKVLVDDSSPVEYDQPLFLVDPS